MRTALRLVGFVTALALVFSTAWHVGAGVGRPAPIAATGPIERDPPVAVSATGPAEPELGLAATAAGYTLVPQTTTFTPGRAGELAFTITGPAGRPISSFALINERALRVTVVRRDGAGYQRLEPQLGSDDRWRAPLVLPAAGVYRLYADFVPTGGPVMVLGADLFAPGEFSPIPLGPNRVVQIDGYQVRLDGDLVPGRPSQVFATVSRNGAPVTDLQPHLGAFGQLTALRRSDLAYMRIPADAAPPAATDRSGPGIAFTAQVPTAGSYRLFLDFRHGAGVHTAEFTVDTKDGIRG